MAEADIKQAGVATVGERFFGWGTVYGFQSQLWLGRLRFHIFWREEPGEAFHDHAWGFVTFPLHSYVEEVLRDDGSTVKQVVRSFRFSHRHATHTHRVLGRWDGLGLVDVAGTLPGKVMTICIRGPSRGTWNYVRRDGGRVRRFPWKAYLRRVDKVPERPFNKRD